MIQHALNEAVLDYQNPFKLYALAREYDKLEQGAGAATFYMRAAENSNEDSEEEKFIQYKSLIFMALIYHREGNRDISVRSIFRHALTAMPEMPEAYYAYSKWLADRHEWQEAYMMSTQGLKCAHNAKHDPDLDYPGDWALKFVHAISKWKVEGSDNSKNYLFDFKFKTRHDKAHEDMIDRWIKQSGYPSTISYTQDQKDDYKFSFPGIEDIKRNYSRHFQDMFVLSVLDGKRNGTFIEIGSGDPYVFNNTALLEESFGWSGISIDNNDRFCYQHSRKRNTQILNADAAQIDYKLFFKMNCLETYTDFLRINAESASLDVLNKIPFNVNEFMVIQFQHNACWWGPKFREESRKLLSQIGYVLMVPDAAMSEAENYEDWWVHPHIAQRKQNMKASEQTNFVYTYMMKDQRK